MSASFKAAAQWRPSRSAAGMPCMECYITQPPTPSVARKPPKEKDTLQLVKWGREMMDGRIFATFGIHPNDFDVHSPEVLRQALLTLEPFKGLGAKAVYEGSALFVVPSYPNARVFALCGGADAT